MRGHPELERHGRSPGIVCGAGDGLLLEALKVLVVLSGHVAQLGDVGIGRAHAIRDQLLPHLLLRSRHPYAFTTLISNQQAHVCRQSALPAVARKPFS